jgi:biopolymer transport protein ExbB
MNAVEAVKQLLIGSGASWVLWFLGALSVASLAIALERWLFYRTREGSVEGLARDIDRRLMAGDVDGAIADLGRSRSVAASIAAAGLRLAALGPEAVAKAMESAAALERALLERRLVYLGTLGNNAPFVGLFGTVVGVIHAFEELGHAAPGHAGGPSAAAQVASQGVMTAVAEALVTTAVGIAVALPAIAFYNYLQRRVATLLSESDALSSLVLAYLSGTPRSRGGSGGGPEKAGAPLTSLPLSTKPRTS